MYANFVIYNDVHWEGLGGTGRALGGTGRALEGTGRLDCEVLH